MRVFVLRHGEAEGFVTSDFDRNLTAKGEADVKALADLLTQERIVIDQAFVSPYIRTQQTAKIMQSGLGGSLPLATTEYLTPENDPDDVIDFLESQHLGDKTILLVSHQPFVSSFIAKLVEGSSRHAYEFPMSPASIAEIKLDVLASGCGLLKRLLSPPYYG